MSLKLSVHYFSSVCHLGPSLAPPLTEPSPCSINRNVCKYYGKSNFSIALLLALAAVSYLCPCMPSFTANAIHKWRPQDK